MTTILHASDLRFGYGDEAFQEVVLREMARHTPDLVVFTGDFTQRGKKEEFTMVRDFLSRITVPVLAVPGDRDLPRFNLWNRWTDPMKLYRDHVAPMPETVYDDPVCHVVGLNTAFGRVTLPQVEFVYRQFRQALPGLVRLLACHHALNDLGGEAEGLSSILYNQCVDLVLTAAATSRVYDDGQGPVSVGIARGDFGLLRLFPEKIDLELIQDVGGPSPLTQSFSFSRRVEEGEE